MKVAIYDGVLYIRKQRLFFVALHFAVGELRRYGFTSD
jgi:hypothetical protein